MGYNFRGGNREQTSLMPPAITDWLPAEHLAWFIIDAVESMDLAPFYAKYRSNGQGSAAWHPKMMVALLLYAYCHGERSSRKIEKLCEESVPYRVITGNCVPDHCSISRFRKDHALVMKALFIEILRLCAEAGLVKVGKVNLDGTKMKANASLAANRTEKSLTEEIDRMLSLLHRPFAPTAGSPRTRHQAGRKATTMKMAPHLRAGKDFFEVSRPYPRKTCRNLPLSLNSARPASSQTASAGCASRRSGSTRPARRQVPFRRTSRFGDHS